MVESGGMKEGRVGYELRDEEGEEKVCMRSQGLAGQARAGVVQGSFVCMHSLVASCLQVLAHSLDGHYF